ncbi:MAG: hypothetical protein ABSC06_28775 [Rhodopila sp.]|jgi:hypothetical protein
MGDPVLEAHQVEERVYLLSGPTPISIRDQMLRGVLLARRLVECGYINSTDRPLLVVGAGAGGATAAITAAIDKKIPTVLVEYHPSPFLAQACARTRFVDPTQYDWPLDHWPRAKFPWGPSLPIPLGFRAAMGRDLSLIWTSRLKKYENDPSCLLEVDYDDHVTDLDFVPNAGGHAAIDVTFDVRKSQRFGAMIWAAGFGQENCTVAAKPSDPSALGRLLYEGQPFWGPDDFTDLRSNVPSPSVLISGSGDGALQDYLRVTTQLDSASSVFNACAIPEEIIPSLQSAEDRAHRGRAWAHHRQHEAPYLAELDSIIDQSVRFALASSSVCNALRGVLANVVPVKLVYRERFLTSHYGLNRFLVLLISAFIEKQSHTKTLFPNTVISHISAANPGHQCLQMGPFGPRAAGQYSKQDMLLHHACFGKDHHVTLESGDGIPISETFNVIIVRHGMPPRDPKDPFPDRWKHILPLHLPP